MESQDNYLIALKRHDLLLDRIYQGYKRYIPCIYQTYTMQRSLASPLSCPSALGSLGPGLPSDLLSLGHRDAAHARLGPSKVPKPGVDLVNMAAPLRGRNRTIGTAALKSVPLSRLLYFCGIVEVVFLSRKHGMRGTLPRRSSTLPT